jgi:hypothetical protein
MTYFLFWKGRGWGGSVRLYPNKRTSCTAIFFRIPLGRNTLAPGDGDVKLEDEKGETLLDHLVSLTSDSVVSKDKTYVTLSEVFHIGEISRQIKHHDYRQRYNGGHPHFHHLLPIGTPYIGYGIRKNPKPKFQVIISQLLLIPITRR